MKNTQNIIDAIAAAHGVSPQSLRGKSRRSAQAKTEAIKALHRIKGMSAAEIKIAMNLGSHNTAIRALRTPNPKARGSEGENPEVSQRSPEAHEIITKMNASPSLMKEIVRWLSPIILNEKPPAIAGEGRKGEKNRYSSRSLIHRISSDAA